MRRKAAQTKRIAARIMASHEMWQVLLDPSNSPEAFRQFPFKTAFLHGNLRPNRPHWNHRVTGRLELRFLSPPLSPFGDGNINHRVFELISGYV